MIFVGKLIVSKGCDLLLAAWPLVAAANPGARLLLVGFGEYRETLERLWAALGAGDLDAAREIARRGWALEGGEEARSALPRSVPRLDLPTATRRPPRRRPARVDLAGRLEYAEVARAVRGQRRDGRPEHLPGGVRDGRRRGRRDRGPARLRPPLAASPRSRTPSPGTLPGELGELTAFDLGPGAVEAIADRLNRWLALPDGRARGSAHEPRGGRPRALELGGRGAIGGPPRGDLGALAGVLDRAPDRRPDSVFRRPMHAPPLNRMPPAA